MSSEKKNWREVVNHVIKFVFFLNWEKRERVNKKKFSTTTTLTPTPMMIIMIKIIEFVK